MSSLECSYNEKERVWSGANPPLVNDFNCSLGKIIYNNLKNFPKKVCQVSDTDGRQVTNEELLLWSTRLALHFKKFGLRYDDVIGIVAKNTTYLSSVAVACFMNCTPFHAVNGALDQSAFRRNQAFKLLHYLQRNPLHKNGEQNRSATNTIQHLFENTAPKVIFCDSEVYDKIHAATRSLRPLLYTLTYHIDGVASVEDLLEPIPNENLYQPEPLMLGGKQTIAILCSSGTTGFPKCVCISNYTWQLDNLSSTRFVTSDDVIFTNSGLDWVSGLFFTILCSTTSCKRVITSRPYTPDYFVELVKKYRLTCIAFAPRNAAALVTCPTATTYNLSTIRSCLIGGGSTSLPTIKRLQSILKKSVIRFIYGLTEVGLVSMNAGDQCLGSVGNLFNGIKARIVDEQGMNLPPHEIGEICVSTGHIWNGYYGNATETQRMQDSFGWFHTGDLGYIDDKQALYIVDRKKDIIKYQGMQYWPAEIEHVISELPEVEDVCVVGVYDERNGDAAGAVVVRRKGFKLTAQQVKEHVSKVLPAYYKQLHAGVVFVDRLPQNCNGKPLKREAKMLFELK